MKMIETAVACEMKQLPMITARFPVDLGTSHASTLAIGHTNLDGYGPRVVVAVVAGDGIGSMAFLEGRDVLELSATLGQAMAKQGMDIMPFVEEATKADTVNSDTAKLDHETPAVIHSVPMVPFWGFWLTQAAENLKNGTIGATHANCGNPGCATDCPAVSITFVHDGRDFEVRMDPEPARELAAIILEAANVGAPLKTN